MFTALRFENFKALRDVSLTDLSPLTVLVGPSGAGKTSILEGLAWLCSLRQEPGDGAHHDWLDAMPTVGSTGFEVEAWEPAHMAASYQRSEKHRREGTIRWRENKGRLEVTQPVPTTNWFQEAANAELLHRLPTALRLQLDTRRIGAASPASLEPRVEMDGAGLATTLAFYAGAYPERLQAIEASLRRIIGHTGKIRTFPARVAPTSGANGHRFELVMDGLGSIRGELLSEGVLLVLAMLAITHQVEGATLLLIDNVDHGLHPDAQRELVGALRGILNERKDVQIICTSHSPYLLDFFESHEVQVLSVGPDNRIAAARLDRHPEWPKWKGMLQAGEFWQSVGEDWVPTETPSEAPGHGV